LLYSEFTLILAYAKNLSGGVYELVRKVINSSGVKLSVKISYVCRTRDIVTGPVMY